AHLAVHVGTVVTERRESRVGQGAVVGVVGNVPVRIGVECVVSAQREHPVVQVVVQRQIEDPLGREGLIDHAGGGVVIGQAADVVGVTAIAGQRAGHSPVA